MSWLFIVTIAHFLNAGAFLVDKFLLAKAVPKPAVYAFWIGVLGLLALVLVPIDYVQPSWNTLIISFAAGATFEIALLFFFAALRRLDTSRVVPVVGGLQPLVIFLLAYFFLNERLSSNEVSAFILLVVGSIVISYDGNTVSPREGSRRRRGWIYACVATIFFAISYTVTKAVFVSAPFFSGLGWIRLGAFFTVLLFLLRREWRHDIVTKQDMPKASLRLLFLAGQVGGAFAAILLNYAIKLSSPTLVAAMQGLQYAFLFVLAIVLGNKYRQLRERLGVTVIVRKVFAIFLISGGLVLLAL